MRKYRNMFVEILRESVIPCWGNVEDTDVPLTNTLPEPLRSENPSTSFSINQKVGVTIPNLENVTLKGLILRKIQEEGTWDLQASSRHQTRKNAKDASHPITWLLIQDHIVFRQLPRSYSFPCRHKKSLVGMDNAFLIS
jgi:hypothetical protein